MWKQFQTSDGSKLFMFQAVFSDLYDITEGTYS